MNEQIIITKGDKGIELSMQFLDKKKNPVNIEGQIIEIEFVTPENERYTKIANIINAEQGTSSFVLDEFETSITGLWAMHWSATDETKHITCQEAIYYYVQENNDGLKERERNFFFNLDNSVELEVIEARKGTDRLRTKIDEIDNDILELKDTFSITGNEIAGILIKINSTQNSVENINGNITEINKRITQINLDTNNIKSSISSHSTSINNLTKEVSEKVAKSELSQTVNTFNVAISEQNKTLNGLGVELSNKVNRTELNQTINGFNILVSEQNKKIDETTNKITDTVTKSELNQTSNSLTATFTDIHNNGFEKGIVKVNKDGIEVSNTKAKTKSVMNSSGFAIIDEKGDVVAWLNDSNRYTDSRVQNIYAKNIRTIYNGSSTLYVNHSATTNGNGTETKPFNNFLSLQYHLEATPIINKNITINVLSTGNIVDDFSLTNLSGTGSITINFAKGLIKKGSSYGIRLSNIENNVTVNGNKTAYNTSDGAVIDKNNCGMWFYKCKYVIVKNICINSVNDGIQYEQSNGYIQTVDFLNTHLAINCKNSSNIHVFDIAGNCTKSLYCQMGGIIHIGKTGASITSQGTTEENSGKIFTYGTLTKTNSYVVAPTTPSLVQTQRSFSYTDYGYFTKGANGININAWNPNGKIVYQGDWSYGNNQGYFTLPNTDIDNFLSNATILDGSSITLKRASSGGYSTPQGVYLRGSTTTTLGSGTPNYLANEYYLGTLSLGEQATFTLPKAFVEGLKNKSIKSICFYVANGSNYIKFDPVCSINLKVQKPYS